MFSRFFINRPIFATVLAILMVLAGGVAFFALPVAQYPEITPPSVKVTARYPGASPDVVADTVAAPIEQEVNGVENMIYMSSNSAPDGSYTLTITFELGTNIDMANVLVQNRVSRALPKLPYEVQRQGVITNKSSTTLVTALGVYAPDGRYDDLYINNYVTLRIRDQLARIKGVGDLTLVPTMDYGMRIWLDPNAMEVRRLTTGDVVSALQQQNVQVAAGQIGQQPAPTDQKFQLTIYTLGRLENAEQFENIVVKTGEDGRVTRVKDIARVELGAKNYDLSASINGKPGTGIIIYQAPGSNALTLADQVRATMDELKKDFPPGLDYKIIYNISDFVRASMHEVQKTLFEAFVLVSLVVFVFLQSWRATLIPSIAIPVSLIGTFAVMTLLGFSINTITLFGLVLAIGIVVDDAIVVVENVERNMTEFSLDGKQAAIRAMEEITGAIVGITLVLMAVFLPSTLLPGITGQLYRQFALTIAVTTLFSAINGLTLSPALCALFLKPGHGRKNIFFRGFNWFFDRITGGYVSIASLAVRRALVSLAVFVAIVVLTFRGYSRVPTGFVPPEDDGLVLVNVQLPDGASLNRTDQVLSRVREIVKKTEGTADTLTMSGSSQIDGAAPYLGTVFVALVPWEERLPHGRSKDVIVADLTREFAQIQDAVVMPFSQPPIPGVGTGTGFEMYVQDRSGAGLDALSKTASEIVRQANEQPDIRGAYTTFRPAIPTLFVDINRQKVLQMNVPLQSVFDAMQAYLGSTYVNDFNKFGRTWQVMVQANSLSRDRASDIARLQIRNRQGTMLPLGTLVTVRDSSGPARIIRYNMFPSVRVAGSPAPGCSSGQALQTMAQIATHALPPGMSYEWTGMSYQEQKVGNQGIIVFGMAILVVFLILAAQYESWADPFAVVLIVPLALLGAVVALVVRSMENNIFTQIGLVLLVGLAAKNAILIVEFARERRAHGDDVVHAAIEGSRLRFRPILMTSFSFILGVVPLVVATGAGAVSRQSLGTGVFGGMLGVTILGIFFTPVLYVLMQRLSGRGRQRPEESSSIDRPDARESADTA